MTDSAQPGWYADPLGRTELRWYDGEDWSEHVRSGALTGTDPIDVSGTPRWPAPRWATGAVTRPAPAAPAAPRRLRVPPLLWGVLAAFVVLVIVTVIAVVALVRNLPRLTESDIESLVAAEMSSEYGSVVTVDCPPAFYVGGSDGQLVCTARAEGFPPAQVRVVVRDSTVYRWEVVGTAAPTT